MLESEDQHQDPVPLVTLSDMSDVSEITGKETFQNIWVLLIQMTMHPVEQNAIERVSGSSVCNMEDNASVVIAPNENMEKPTIVICLVQEIIKKSVVVVGLIQFGKL